MLGIALALAIIGFIMLILDGMIMFLKKINDNHIEAMKKKDSKNE